MKLRFGFLFKYFPQDKTLCSHFAGNSGVPQTAHLQFRQNPQALVWKWRQNFTFKINIPAVNAPASNNKSFIFKLTIEDYFRNHSELIGSKFLQLALIKSVAFCWDTRYEFHGCNMTEKGAKTLNKW